MPRANRYFLPGYVWHITTNIEASSKTFQPFNRFAPFKTFKARTRRRRSALDFVCSITL